MRRPRNLAVEYARKAVERYPHHPANLLALAEALEASGEKQAARAAWEEAAAAAAGAARAGDPDGPDWQEEAAKALRRSRR